MPIFRTAPNSNFTIVTNDIATAPMAFKAKDLLLYLISKPPEWKVIKANICKELQLSMYIVKKSLQWLARHGYAFYQHSHTGYGSWHIFDTPQQKKNATAPAITPKFAIPTMALQPPLVITETDTKIEKQPQPEFIEPPIQTASVVVSENEELVYPAQLNPDQKKASKAIIKKVKQPELQQPVLFALAYALTNGNIKSSVPGYLNSLVTAANNGTFTPIQAAGATKASKPLIPLWQGFGHSTPSKPEVANGFIQKMRAAARGATG